MPTPLSAIDAISPALERTKRLLFKPFRLGIWIRFAILAVLTGEYSGGFNGSGFNGAFTPRSQPSQNFAAGPSLPPFFSNLPHMIGLLAILALVFVVFMLLIMFISSVLRFVLFDSVVTGNIRLREGWKKWWHEQGVRLFLWQLGFSLVTMALWTVVLGIPILIAWKMGLFKAPSEHLALLILGGMALFLVSVVLIVISLVIWLFTKDFVVPLMAVENLSAVEAWKRLLPMLQDNKGSYAGYVGMKVVLAIAAAIMFGIIDFIVLLALLIPLGIAVTMVIMMVPGIGWNAFTITAAIVCGAILIALIISIIAFISVPAAVFFQSYGLHFFAGRYDKLRELLYPEPPPAPPAVADIPPEAPPLPA